MRLRSAILAALLLFPLTGSAAATLSVSEIIAGVGGEARIEGLAPDTTGTVRATSPSGRTFDVPFTTSRQGTAFARILGTHVQESGTYRALLALKSGSLAETSFVVLADKFDARRSSVTASSDRLLADGQSSVNVTVKITDRFGNPLSGRPVELIASRTEDQVRASSSTTGEDGIISFTVKTTKAGSITLRAFDLLSALTLDETATVTASVSGIGSDVGTMYPSYPIAPQYGGYMPYFPPYPYYPSYGGFDPLNASLFGGLRGQVTFGEIDRFELKLNPQTIKTNDAASLTVTALDRDGKIVQDYTGRPTIFSPTDSTATVPNVGTGENGKGSFLFDPRSLGSQQLPLSIVFRKSGKQKLRVEDRSGAKVVFGEVEADVTGDDVILESDRIAITYPVKNGFVNDTTFTLTGNGPIYSDLEITVLGGSKDLFIAETDGQGAFSTTITLTPGRDSYLLRVKRKDGRGDSGDIPFQVDATAPFVQSTIFNPEKPQPKDNVLMTVITDAGSTVKVTVKDQEYSLVPNSSKPDQYQVAFPAPEAGNYQLLLVVTDAAKNVTQQRINFKVHPEGFPIVRNVRAEVINNQVKLMWEQVDGATSYNIYVGESPDNLLLISTGRAVGEALISDLKPGKQYVFAVSATDGGRESVDKSEFVSARPLGASLAIESQNEALQLKIEYPGEIALGAWVVEYGVDTYTERRLFNGSMRVIPLRYLLPEVRYKVRVTPVGINGEAFTEQAAESEGQVLAATGFHPLPGELVSALPGPDLSTPPDALHDAAPSTAQSGLPYPGLLAAFAIAAAASLILVYNQRRAQSRGAEFLKTMEERYQKSL